MVTKIFTLFTITVIFSIFMSGGKADPNAINATPTMQQLPAGETESILGLLMIVLFIFIFCAVFTFVEYMMLCNLKKDFGEDVSRKAIIENWSTWNSNIFQ